MPNLPGEGAANQDVLHRFVGLITEGASIIVRQAVESKSHGGPAAIEVGKPGTNLDAKGCPASPGDSIEGSVGGDGKKGMVA